MFSNGTEWQEQRRFSLRNLRDLGFGKMSMEHLIHEEAIKCIHMIKKDLATRQEFVLNNVMNTSQLCKNNSV